MNNPIYEINTNSKILVFCNKEDYDGAINDQHIFTNFYIYGDDTLIEVINKIKISMINYLPVYKLTKFENISGFLSSKWDFYDNYTIKQYLKLNDSFIDKYTFINKLSYIDKKYNNESLLDETNINMNNIDLNNIESINNELVIGYFDRNIVSNYTYYMSVLYMNRLIETNSFLENELNKPINHYRNFTNGKPLTKFNFTINNNDNFKKQSFITTPVHLEKNIDNLRFLNNIYNVDNINKTHLNSTILDIENENNLYNTLIKGINLLSLEIHGYKNYDLINIYNTIKLNENCPICILSYKKKKKNLTYKLYKKNGIPFIKQDILEKLLDKKKLTEKRDYLLYKVYCIINNFKTDYLIDVYIIENTYFFINFDFINNYIDNININDIIFNINNILNLLNLNIADKKKINDMNEFNNYNYKNIIVFNNDNNYISSSFNLILNYTELEIPIPTNNIHKFFNFLILFNNFFDIYIDNLEVIYQNKLYSISHISNEEIFLKKKSKPIPIDNAKDITIKTSKITLYYKKSYNYDSYNYLQKFFKYVSTFELNNLAFNYNCIFSTEKTLAPFKEFLYYNNYKKYDNIYEKFKDDINYILDKTNYNQKNYCEYLLKKSNQKTKINIDIDSDIFYINVYNVNTLNELNNIVNTFNNYIRFTNTYDLTSSKRLTFSENNYLNMDDTIFNKYNNIFNIHNTLSKSSNKEYYLHLFYTNVYQNTDIKEEDNDTDLDMDFDISDSDSDDENTVETEQIVIDDLAMKYEETIDNIDNYKTIVEYKSQFYNGDNKDKMKSIFGENFKNSKCTLERRPSILPTDLVDRILKKEEDNKIVINKKKNQKVFSELLNIEENILNFTINKNIIVDNLKIYMGRSYKFNIKYEYGLDYKLVLLFNENNSFINDEGFLNRDSLIKTDYENNSKTNTRLEIYLENNTKINLDTYLYNTTDTDYYFKLNFPQNSTNDMYNNYVLCLYNKESDTLNLKSMIKLDLNKPFNYYYDNYSFGENYFIYLPGKSINTQKSKPLHPYNINNMICCYSNAPHIYKNLANNDKRDPHNNIKQFTNEEDFKLDNYKISVIPKDIYINISKFLGITSDLTNYYNINKLIQPYHAYRFGLSYNSNINNLLYCILNIIKLSNKKLNTKLAKIFNLENIIPNNIKEAFLSCIDDIEIINKTDLLKLNNNIYSKNTKVKELEKLIKLDKSTKKDFIKTTKTHYQEIQKGLKLYIDTNFLNLDINFLWNICSIIFNINIIIFELKFTNVLKSSIKCPLVNNHNIYDFNNRDTCFILNYDNTYQPITIPTVASANSFKYNLMFDLKNKNSIINLNNLFSKCLLRYNNDDYNTLLINYIYFNIDYSNNIVIDTKEINDIKQYIKFIVINSDYIKLGVIFEINKKHLFIPLNYIKHNINYNIIEKDYKYIYKSKKDTDKEYLHDFNTTTELITQFQKILQENNLNFKEKLNVNNKFLTDGKYIIGIGLNIGDYIPIIPRDITDEEDDIEFSSELILSDISYLDQDIHNDSTKEELYNKFEYVDLYYKQFISSINSVLIQKKTDILNIINDKVDLKVLINNLIYDLFKFNTHMYLHNNKPDNNIINNFKTCNTLEVIDCDNNCIVDNDSCKYIITERYYEIFLDFLINDLVYNHYKRNIILSKSNNILIDILNNDKYIVLDHDNIDKYVIHNLYNKILTDKQYYMTGIDYENNIINTDRTDIVNENYCSTRIYDDNLDLYYFNFKSLSKLNVISYSNCIYYNLGKHYVKDKNINYINTVRSLIGNKLIELLKNDTYNIFDIINYYSEKNSNHLYSDIQDANDLFQILISDSHWITELDLYIFSLITEKKIIFYTDINQTNIIHNIDIDDKGSYMIMNETFSETIKIFVKDFYYKKIYLLIDSK